MGLVRWFYGWTIVAATFVLTFIGYGIAFSFAAFFPYLQREFGAARGTISLLFSLSGFLYFALGAATGPLADRIGPRRVAAAGMLLLAVGLALASQARTLLQVCIGYGLGVGLGVGCTYVPAIGAVQRFFVAKRGLATGLAVAGIGVGTLVMPIASRVMIEATGWRRAYLLLALLAATLGLAAALCLEHSPSQRGLMPDGKKRALGNADAIDALRADRGPTLWVAVTSRPFRLLYAASFMSGFGLYIPVAHLAAYARDQGLSEQTGLWLVALIGVGSTAGRFATGAIADRLGRRQTLIILFAALAFILVGWLASVTVLTLAVFALLFGVGWGGFIALLPALSADYFAGAHGTGVFGLLATNFAFSALLGPALAGFAFDATGSYALPIVASALANVIAVICMLSLESPETWRSRICKLTVGQAEPDRTERRPNNA
jgi:MFS family permease